ncbi:3371_t:CDS:2 [Acaulospora morrowiae]|uniref:3371_t:CDS:1 n=1 Tax=Acaulospora morrowiae TaxID=94023 RepID=A0A9N9FVS6_9GLOM|nr:3371_t:CDS:2 [Acaulospora morrowiae]
MARYFPALDLLFDSLDNYSLCEKHYNHIITRKCFIGQLVKQNNLTQVYFPNSIYEMLVKRIDELENLNRQLLLKNEILRGQLLDDQQDCIKFIMEIAKKKLSNIYSDITSLIENQK